MHFPYRGHPLFPGHVVQNFLVVAAREFGAEVSREEDSRQTSDTIHNRIAASILHIVADNFFMQFRSPESVVNVPVSVTRSSTHS